VSVTSSGRHIRQYGVPHRIPEVLVDAAESIEVDDGDTGGRSRRIGAVRSNTIFPNGAAMAPTGSEFARELTLEAAYYTRPHAYRTSRQSVLELRAQAPVG
jgi:hypothetical protein